jgi:hypothetical protein
MVDCMNFYWALYTAPSAASNARHYIVNYLKATMGSESAPAVAGLKIAQYVIICNVPSQYYNWAFACLPDIPKSVQL